MNELFTRIKYLFSIQTTHAFMNNEHIFLKFHENNKFLLLATFILLITLDGLANSLYTIIYKVIIYRKQLPFIFLNFILYYLLKQITYLGCTGISTLANLLLYKCIMCLIPSLRLIILQHILQVSLTLVSLNNFPGLIIWKS